MQMFKLMLLWRVMRSSRILSLNYLRERGLTFNSKLSFSMIHQGKKYLCLFADMIFHAFMLLTDKLLLVVIVVKVKMWTDFVR